MFGLNLVLVLSMMSIACRTTPEEITATPTEEAVHPDTSKTIDLPTETPSGPSTPTRLELLQARMPDFEVFF